ncbi:MAG TPA: biopolymer transporter ExbD [Planctomycetota bacterium]|nr:biopolymer transporter ExbD [Planctomycetota bacterium]
MGRFRDAAADDELETGIDLSPLIDCVFILLIFFIVTTVFVEETGIEVTKPPASSSEPLEKISLLFAVTEQGQIVYGGKEVGVQGVRAIVERALREEQVPVIIQGDQAAPHGVVTKVLDEAKLGGAEIVNIATSHTAR